MHRVRRKGLSIVALITVMALNACNQRQEQRRLERAELGKENQELTKYFAHEKQEYTARIGREISTLEQDIHSLKKDRMLNHNRLSEEAAVKKILVLEQQRQQLKEELRTLDRMNQEEKIHWLQDRQAEARALGN